MILFDFHEFSLEKFYLSIESASISLEITNTLKDRDKDTSKSVVSS